jgi:hypothetical protein
MIERVKLTGIGTPSIFRAPSAEVPGREMAERDSRQGGSLVIKEVGKW